MKIRLNPVKFKPAHHMCVSEVVMPTKTKRVIGLSDLKLAWYCAVKTQRAS